MKPVCVPVALGDGLKSQGVARVRYSTAASDRDALNLIVELAIEAGPTELVFESPVGFRILDERDLLEFWNDFSLPNGWLWEVRSGGWLELESSRDGFLDRELMPEVREYLVVGDMCVSVICSKPPHFGVSAG